MLKTGMLIGGLLLSTLAFGEIKSFTVCDHNKGEFSLVNLDKRKIKDGCISCSISGLNNKCCLGTDRGYYLCGISVIEEGYPSKFVGAITYYPDKDKIEVRESDKLCITTDHFIDKVGPTKFEIKKCY